MNINYSVPQNVLVNDDGEPLQAIPELIYGNHLDVVFTARDGNNDAVDLSSAVTWEFAIDLDRTDRTLPLCSTSSITYDTTAKTLSCSVSARTLIFLEAVNGKSQVALIAEMSGFDSSGNRIFRFPWNMTGVMPVDANETVPENPAVQTNDYTAFEVYPNETAIAAETEHPVLGHITTAIPAQMTEKFVLRTNYRYFDSDIIVDWGDGTVSTIRNGDFESEDLSSWDRENQYEAAICMSHTYPSEGKYTVSIYGRKYFGISHARAPENNLMSRCLDTEFPLAGQVNNLSSFARYGCRLKELCIPTAMDLHNVENVFAMCQGCTNLQYAYGLKRKIKISRSFTNLFDGCSALLQTDFVMPVMYIDVSAGLQMCFNGCGLLATPVQKLLPSAGFCNRVMNVQKLFYGCASLTGTVPAAVLWEDTSKVWQNTSNVFKNCSAAIRAQVPVSWGGTLAN